MSRVDVEVPKEKVKGNQDVATKEKVKGNRVELNILSKNERSLLKVKYKNFRKLLEPA